jgi:hypothetical protein
MYCGHPFEYSDDTQTTIVQAATEDSREPKPQKLSPETVQLCSYLVLYYSQIPT